jgi:Mandelate racemase / muconate lactonizing enzyme, N-terminal domain
MKTGRRDFLQASSVVGLAGLLTPRGLHAQEAAARATRGMPSPRIKNITVTELEPSRRIEVVKIITDQDGLYGYGDATAGFRDELVKPAVEEYLKPLLVGQPTERIEDIWHQCYLSSYYKNDNVLNSAISGVDQALWDIKGRQVGQPVYQLIGGKCREAAQVYMHAGSSDPAKVVENAKKLVAQGVRYIHVDMGQGAAVQTLAGGQGFDRDAAVRDMLKIFETFRSRSGWAATSIPSSTLNGAWNSARTRRNSSSILWKTRSRRRIRIFSARSGRNATRRSLWVSFSTNHMSGKP